MGEKENSHGEAAESGTENKPNRQSGTLMMIDAHFVQTWASKYPVAYDTANYDPYIKKARKGDHSALRKLIEWKNVGKGPSPMPLAGNKEQPFQIFLHNLPQYTGNSRNAGMLQLRKDFANRAPVYSIFWCHVLFKTPLFDVYTNMAMTWDQSGSIPSKQQAKIKEGSHWALYNQYCNWFTRTLRTLQASDPQITDRDFDRAMFAWGRAQSPAGKSQATTSRMKNKKNTKRTATMSVATATPTTPSIPSAGMPKFWRWLSIRREVSTLGGRTTVTGCAHGDKLILTLTSGTRKTLDRTTVVRHCDRVIRNGRSSLSGDGLYVAAFLIEYLKQ